MLNRMWDIFPNKLSICQRSFEERCLTSAVFFHLSVHMESCKPKLHTKRRFFLKKIAEEQLPINRCLINCLVAQDPCFSWCKKRNTPLPIGTPMASTRLRKEAKWAVALLSLLLGRWLLIRLTFEKRSSEKVNISSQHERSPATDPTGTMPRELQDLYKASSLSNSYWKWKPLCYFFLPPQPGQSLGIMSGGPFTGSWRSGPKYESFAGAKKILWYTK